MSSSETPLTKIQATERLVDSSIRMLFRREDPLTIQLVAASSYRLLRDLADKKGDIEIRKVEMDFVAASMQKDYYSALAEIANFLKHADKDPDGVLAPFDEMRNDIDITSCVFYLSALGATLSIERLAFLQWCAFIYPHFFKDTAPFRRLSSQDRFENLTEASREEQLAAGQEILTDLRQAIRAGA